MYNAILVLFYAIVYAYCFRYERAPKQMRAISPYDNERNGLMVLWMDRGSLALQVYNNKD